MMNFYKILMRITYHYRRRVPKIFTLNDSSYAENQNYVTLVILIYLLVHRTNINITFEISTIDNANVANYFGNFVCW